MRASVTAVIPAYQAEPFVADAVRSVLDQTVPVLECLVIDDGSSDRTAEVAGALAADGPVRVISTANGGVARARNTGIWAAQGTVVAFLDADDAWLPHKTGRQLDALEHRPGAVAVYGGIVLADDGLRPGLAVPPPTADDALTSVLLLRASVPSLAQTGMILTEVLRRVGGFDVDLSTSADADLLYRLSVAGPLASVPDAVALYRCHAGQMHHDLAALERDMSRLFDRVYAPGAAPVAVTERAARAALERTLAKGHAANGSLVGGARHAVRALGREPLATIADLGSSLAAFARRRLRVA